MDTTLAGADDDDTNTEPDADDAGGGLSWGRAVTLALAVGFLGVAVGVVVSRDRGPGEGSVEVGFYRDMITHHEQALAVANSVAANAGSATVRSFAREVLLFQSMEIGVMRQSLRGWGASDGRPAEAMAWMGMAVPYEQMPGLLSDEDIERVTSAEGTEADALFLELMAEHHRGGLHMAAYAADEASDDGVRELAERIERNQAAEINEYRGLAEREGIAVDIDPVSLPD